MILHEGHRSRRILVVSNYFPPEVVGGAEIIAFRQAQALSGRGHDVTVLAGAHHSTLVGSLGFEVFDGLAVYRLALRSLDPNQNFFWTEAENRLRAIIHARDIDVVLMHTVMGFGANLIPAAKSAGARCIVTLHDHWGFCFREIRLRPNGILCGNHEECALCLKSVDCGDGIAIPMRLRRDYVAWCLAQADQLLTPSRYLAQAYREADFPGERISVHGFGIDLDAIPSVKDPPRAAPVRFLCAAYLGEHKGIPQLLEAAKLLASDHSLDARWRLTIAGDGHLATHVAAALRQPDLAAHIRWLGRIPRPELLRTLSATDVVVLPSVCQENRPLSMLEAIASGSAQIATRLGGNSELIVENRSGFLVTPGDPAELAATMRRYITDPNLAVEHGTFNLERRFEFDDVRTMAELEAIVVGEPNAAVATASVNPVIVCGAHRPPEAASALVDALHRHLPPGPIPRLIWHSWADTAVWDQASLLWLWDKGTAEWLRLTALRRGVPILAPDTDWARAMSRHYGGVVIYRTYLEAMAALRILIALPGIGMSLGFEAGCAAAAATALASRFSFGLNADSAR